MLDLGWPELLVVAVVLILVVGPKDLPEMLRTFGRSTKKLRAMAGDFRKQFDDALKEAELGDVSDMISDAQKLNPRNMIKDVIDPLESAGRDIKAGLDDAMKTSGPSPSTPAKSEKVSENKTQEAPKVAATKKKPAAAKKTGAAAGKAGSDSKLASARSGTKSTTAKRKTTTTTKSAAAKGSQKPATSRNKAPSATTDKSVSTKKPARRKPSAKSGDAA